MRWGVGLCRKANQIIRKVAFVVKMVENLASKSSVLIVSFTNCLSFLTLLTADLHAFILPCKYFLATLQGFWQIFIKHSTTAFFFYWYEVHLIQRLTIFDNYAPPFFFIFSFFLFDTCLQILIQSSPLECICTRQIFFYLFMQFDVSYAPFHIPVG